MTARSAAFPMLLITLSVGCCGPEIQEHPEFDPEETFTAFCEALFACPEEEAVGLYESQEGCEDVHRMNYQERNSTCKERVLMLEDCLADLTCQELDDYVEARGSACDDERDHLVERCTPL